MKQMFSIARSATGLMSFLCLGLLLTSCQTNPPVTKAPPANPVAAAPATPVNQPSPAQHIQNGVQLQAGKLNVKVQFYAGDVVRVLKWGPGGTPAKASLVVIQTNPPDLNINVDEGADTVTLASGKLKLLLSKNDGAIQYLDANNQIILKEQGSADITPVNIAHETNAFSVQQNFTLTPDEGIYGLGQHQSGYMNYRGRTVKLVQANTEAVTPFLISTRGYGILWDNYSKTIFADDPDHMSLWSEVGDNLDYYFICGQNMDGAIAGYRELTGQAPMYGKWAYGYWQSKEHYATRDELLGIAQKYRTLQIPIDGLVQDWNYWGGNTNWSSMFFDETLYPNPKEMIDILHQQNFHLIISIWEGLGPATAIYKDMEKRGYLYSPVGWAGFRYYDVYNPAANDLYWQYVSKGLFSKGIDGWWMDSTEPDFVNALTKEGEEYEMKRVEDNHLGSFARYLNPYSLLVTEAVYNHQRAETDQKRVYILTRSTFAGQQRAAATTCRVTSARTGMFTKSKSPRASTIACPGFRIGRLTSVLSTSAAMRGCFPTAARTRPTRNFTPACFNWAPFLPSSGRTVRKPRGKSGSSASSPMSSSNLTTCAIACCPIFIHLPGR